jgi:hypothetical protein
MKDRNIYLFYLILEYENPINNKHKEKVFWALKNIQLGIS